MYSSAAPFRPVWRALATGRLGLQIVFHDLFADVLRQPALPERRQASPDLADHDGDGGQNVAGDRLRREQDQQAEAHPAIRIGVMPRRTHGAKRAFSAALTNHVHGVHPTAHFVGGDELNQRRDG